MQKFDLKYTAGIAEANKKLEICAQSKPMG